MFSGVRWRISVYLTKTYQNTYQIAYIQLILCLLTIFYKITIVPHTDTNSRPTDYKSVKKAEVASGCQNVLNER